MTVFTDEETAQQRAKRWKAWVNDDMSQPPVKESLEKGIDLLASDVLALQAEQEELQERSDEAQKYLENWLLDSENEEPNEFTLMELLNRAYHWGNQGWFAAGKAEKAKSPR